MQSSSSSSENVAEMNRDLNRFITLHSNLRNAMGPCYREEEGELRWCCSDVETMTQVVHLIDAFLDCISIDISQHRLVKESVADIFATLANILCQKNEREVKFASDVMAKMVNIIPSSVFEILVSDIVNLVSSSLPSCPDSVITSCAIKLNWILEFLNPERETLVWKYLEEKKTIDNIINHLCTGGIKDVIFFWETINLLTRILGRWPSSRFRVWNNSVLMNVLYTLSLKPYDSLKVAVLHLYSAIALCNNGAKELLNSEDHSLQLMINCMDGSNPDYLKLAGFNLAECFVESEEGRTKMIRWYREPLVKAIVNELSKWSLYSENPTADQMSLIKSACCVSKIICWPGLHHVYFWELGIESVLLKLLLPNSHIKQLPKQFLSTKELIKMALDIHELKPHVWDILGGLAANLAQKFDAQKLKSKIHLESLIFCACIGFVESLCSVCENRENDVNEPVCRAVLLMIYSPSKYIVSEVKSLLTKLLERSAKSDISFLLNSLKETVSPKLHVAKLISLACYSGLSTYRLYVRDGNGIKILLSYIEELYRNRHNIQPLRMNTNASLHICDHNKNMCCYEYEEDRVGDEFMFFGLLGLAELIRRISTWKDQPVWLTESGEAQLKTIMQDICINYSASGPRWYAAYILSHFGVYGFPSKIGNRIGAGSNPEEVKVDGLVATIRCRKLQFAPDNVNKEALQKFLEYVYSGYLRLENQDLMKSLNQLARKYHLSDLSQILGRSRPIWRTPFPKFDLTYARVLDSRHLWDIVLVAKRNTFVDWKCETCSLSQPHLHAHKAILCPSCVFIKTKLRYELELQESGMDCIEADIGWEALGRLVNWFYSGETVPRPDYGCLWRNLDENEKIEQLIPYVELYCLSDYWLLKDLHQECETVISTCLDSVDIELKVRQMIADRLGLEAHELDEYIANMAIYINFSYPDSTR